MYTLFAAIVPVFIIILIGMAVERTSLIPESAGQVLGIFVVNVAMPCLLFHAMSQVTVEQLAQGGWWLVQVAAQLIFFAVFFAIDRLRGCSFGACVISGISVGFPNAAFVGLPVVMSLMPGNSEALTVAGLCLVATNINGVLAPVALGAWNRKRRGEKTESASLPASNFLCLATLSPVLRFLVSLLLFCTFISGNLWTRPSRWWVCWPRPACSSLWALASGQNLSEPCPAAWVSFCIPL